MRGYLKRLFVALGECVVIAAAFLLLYAISYLIFYQEFPRWK